MGKPQALVSKRIEWLPISRPQNRMYSDRLLSVLDKRVRNDPALFVFYRNGRVVSMDRSDQGIAKFRGIVEVNRKRKLWDRFAIYTLANRAYLNDVEALVTRIARDERIAPKNFARARNTTEEVRRDINRWVGNEVRAINRSRVPLERRYRKTLARLEAQEKRVRKVFLKRIEKARDAGRQKSLRAERDRRIEQLRAQRKRLRPMRENILKLQAAERSFEAVRL